LHLIVTLAFCISQLACALCVCIAFLNLHCIFALFKVALFVYCCYTEKNGSRLFSNVILPEVQNSMKKFKEEKFRFRTQMKPCIGSPTCVSNFFIRSFLHRILIPGVKSISIDNQILPIIE
jgi:hypothetical protein